MDTLTPTLNDSQLKQNIDALQKQGVGNDKIQSYVNNYSKAADGSYSLKSAGSPVLPMISGGNMSGSTDMTTTDSTLNLAKTIGDVVTHSEQETGKDIAAATGGNTMADELAKVNKSLSDSDINYLKAVQKNRQAAISSGDTANVDRYNRVLQNFHTSNGQSMADLFPSLNKSNGQVIGDFAGVALDALLAGSFGEASSGAKFLPEAADVFGNSGKLTAGLSKTAAAAELAKATATARGIETVDGAGKIIPVTEQAIKPATITQKLTNFGMKTGEGAGIGYGYDVANNLQQGQTGAQAFTPGIGTAVGGATPLIGAALKGIVRAGAETLGVSTGAGYGALKEGYNAAAQGGESGTAFRSAMRGSTGAEDIVNSAKEGLGSIIDSRNDSYSKQLETLASSKKTFDFSPVQQKFDSTLSKYGVTVDDKGALDFTRAPGLGRYESDVKKVAAVLNDWGSQPGDRTIVGIDKLKQTLDDFRIGSQDSKKFDAFVTGLRNEAQGLIINEPGYRQMVNNYANTTGLLKEIQRGLSLGDRAQTDTSFRKLTTALRQNNEFRLQLVNELNQETGGKLTGSIAGQQLSPLIPRGGIAKVLDIAVGGAGATGGVGLIPALGTMMTTSPRLVGEFVNALGWSAGKSQALIDFIQKNATKSGAVAGKVSGATSTLGVPSSN